MEILLFTSYYPHNFGDAVFIKPEIPFLSKTFDKIHVINMLNESLQYKKVDVPANFYIVPPNDFLHKLSNKKKWILSGGGVFFHPFKLFFILLFELVILLKGKKLNIQVFKTAIIYLLNANLLALIIKQYLLQNPEIKIIYTYWFKYETLASLICKKYFNMPVKCITRTHGGDLYEFEQKNNYQPYKKWMDKHIDRVFFASKSLYDYYLRLFAGSHKNKYIVSKLGTENPYTLQDTSNHIYVNGKLNIVSCAYMITRKRIHLIIEALSKIDDISIKWVHIGDGEERNKLENMAKKLLEKENISYSFLGSLDNDNIKKYYYDNHFDCFVSLTEAEGGNPVSMMEAMSFGIPIIATNVGGIPEIVNNDTGILLDPDNCVEELINALHKIASMTIQEAENLRKSCRGYWEDNYRAETQYPQFIKYLKDLNN